MDSDWLEVIDWDSRVVRWCPRPETNTPHLLCNQLQTAARLAALCSLYMALFPNQELQQAAPLMQSMLCN